MALKDLKKQAGDLFRSDSEKLAARERENEAYRAVAEELAAGDKDLGAWTKALADSGGNEKAAEILYIERMVEFKELRELEAMRAGERILTGGGLSSWIFPLISIGCGLVVLIVGLFLTIVLYTSI